MAEYIGKDALVAWAKETYLCENASMIRRVCYKQLLEHLNTLEVKEVDLKKLGEIARHLIAVKGHIEDMRLDKEEWLMLEKIGYPENFKAQKGE